MHRVQSTTAVRVFLVPEYLGDLHVLFALILVIRGEFVRTASLTPADHGNLHVYSFDVEIIL